MITFNVYNNKNQAVRDAFEMLAANVNIINTPKNLRTIAVTSCNPEEGKTSLAIGLAVAMANSGWSVLLIDADMRKPSAAKRLNYGVELGLSDFLSGKAEFHEVTSETNIENLHYITCGNDISSPIALLNSSRFETLMKNIPNEYNYVIFDTPALTSVVDGILVSSMADATLLVTKFGSTQLRNLKRVKLQLESSNARLLGVVLNKVNKHDYKRYFGSYNYFFNLERFENNRKPRRSRKK